MKNKETISIEQIEKTEKEMKEENNKTFTLEKSGVKVSCNQEEFNGHTLMKARELQEGTAEKISLSIYLASVVCTFDGENKTPTEILNLPLSDVLQLEEEILIKK